MNILFIYSLDEIYSVLKPLLGWVNVPFGISYLSSMLKKHGHHTQLIVLGSNKVGISQQLVYSTMEKTDPDIVCFTAVSSQYKFIKNMAS
jgi:hypothetical protein